MSRRTSPHLAPARLAMALAFGLGLATGMMGCPKKALVQDSDWIRSHASDEVRATLEDALEAYDGGSMQACLALLKTARSQTSDTLLLAFIGLREGMVHLRLGSPQAASSVLEPVISSGHESLASRAKILRGLALAKMDRLEEAAPSLLALDLPAARQATDDPVLVTELLVASGDIALGKMLLTDAGQRFAWATQDLGASQQAIDMARALLEKIDAGIQACASQPGCTPPSFITLLVSLTPRGPFWALVARRAASEALVAWDLVKAEKLVQELRAQGFDTIASPLEMSIETARNELEGTDPSTIGALLPLSGKNAGIGQMMRDGIETALRILGAEHEFNVVFLDTADSPELAREHMHALKTQHRAIAVIGPAAGTTAVAASEEADVLGMPLITLTLKPGITAKSPYVLRNFSTHDKEADILASYAVEKAGLTQLGIVHPDTTYGKAMAARFTERVVALGGKVLLAQSFPSSELNFVDLATKVKEQPELQGLFVPATSQQLGLIGPALAYRDVWAAPLEKLADPSKDSNVRRLLVLAPQVAYSPGLPAKAGKYLQGVVFSAGFFPETSDPFATFFIQEFERDHTATVTSYHAYAADALFVLAAAVAVDGVRTRTQLAAWLVDPASCSAELATVASFGGFDKSGEPVAPLALLRLVGTTFEALPP